jgi:hypothetical protein
MAARILRYIKGTLDYAITFCGSARQPIQAYADADYAGDNDRKSQSGYKGCPKSPVTKLFLT